METSDLYKLKIDLELKASQVWNKQVTASDEIGFYENSFSLYLNDYCVIVHPNENEIEVLNFPSFETVRENTFRFTYFTCDFASCPEIDLALAICLGLQQAKDNEKLINNSLLSLTNLDWNRNLSITHSIDPQYIALFTLSKPKDSDGGKSNALAYPMDREGLKAMYEVLGRILEKG